MYKRQALIGFPSVAVLVLYVLMRLRDLLARPQPSSAGVANPDIFLLLFDGVNRLVATLAGIVGTLGHMALTALSVVAVVGALFAAALWSAGRGLETGAAWARILTTALSLLLLLPSLVLLLSSRGLFRVLSLAIVLSCLWVAYSVWRDTTAPQDPPSAPAPPALLQRR